MGRPYTLHPVIGFTATVASVESFHFSSSRRGSVEFQDARPIELVEVIPVLDR